MPIISKKSPTVGTHGPTEPEKNLEKTNSSSILWGPLRSQFDFWWIFLGFRIKCGRFPILEKNRESRKTLDTCHVEHPYFFARFVFFYMSQPRLAGFLDTFWYQVSPNFLNSNKSQVLTYILRGNEGYLMTGQPIPSNVPPYRNKGLSLKALLRETRPHFWGWYVRGDRLTT